MRVIQFTSPSNEQILAELKTITARFWRKAPPRLSEILRAQTGRKKLTTFAYLRVVGLALWRPKTDTSRDIEQRLGYSLGEIAEKEGFRSWEEFVNTYVALNQHHDPDDPLRRHYFIEFELVSALDPNQLMIEETL